MSEILLKNLQVGILSLSTLSLLVACRINDIEEPLVNEEPGVESPVNKSVNENQGQGNEYEKSTVESPINKPVDENQDNEYKEPVSKHENLSNPDPVNESKKYQDDLYVNPIEEFYRVENYVGEEYEEIRAKLTELGFDVIKEEESSDASSIGQIIRQDQAVDTEVISSETTITFVVSTGKPVIELRNLFEYSRTSVEDYAERNGLNLTSEEQSSEEVAVGLVMSQEPAAKTSLHAGDRIKVIYSTGPE